MRVHTLRKKESERNTRGEFDVHRIGRCTSLTPGVQTFLSSASAFVGDGATLPPIRPCCTFGTSDPDILRIWLFAVNVGMYRDVQAKNRSNRSFVLRVHPRKLSTCDFPSVTPLPGLVYTALGVRNLVYHEQACDLPLFPWCSGIPQ